VLSVLFGFESRSRGSRKTPVFTAHGLPASTFPLAGQPPLYCTPSPLLLATPNSSSFLDPGSGSLAAQDVRSSKSSAEALNSVASQACMHACSASCACSATHPGLAAGESMGQGKPTNRRHGQRLHTRSCRLCRPKHWQRPWRRPPAACSRHHMHGSSMRHQQTPPTAHSQPLNVRSRGPGRPANGPLRHGATRGEGPKSWPA
jgi:hypothetical protein